MRNPLTAQQLTALGRVLALGLLAFAWIQLAPQQLGGRADYVVTDGVSMEPHFHTGDLAIVRREGSYHVGEIVAYRSRMLHTTVLHRIVRIQDGHYWFKGDNNSFIDPEHPAKSQLVGALWVHAPGLGQRLNGLRSPLLTGLLVALAAVLFGGGAFQQGRRRRRNRHAHSPTLPPAALNPMVVLGGALALATAVTVFAYTRPATGYVPESVSYRQAGTFHYSAATAPGPAYASGRVTTGAPVFTRLVDGLDVGFHYRFSTAAAHRMAGTASLKAKLSSSTGWSRTLVLERPKAFEGDRVSLSGRIDLKGLEALAQQVEDATSVNATYTLTVEPHVRVVGDANRISVRAAFAPTYPLAFGEYELTQPTTPLPLRPAAGGTARASVVRRLEVSALGVGMNVSTLRLVAGLALAALLALLVGHVLGSGGGLEPGATVPARIRRLLVPVDRIDWEADAPVVEMPNLDELASIAGRYERAILHVSSAAVEVFGVAEDGVLYRFRIPLKPRFEVVRATAKTS